mmetsp:Transcript_10809/g.37443  ORF Transcript_10809/g.37443 Transcript_10809/m.37443 type:complete len:255 (+) Transcript_10809:166-930(+)
MRASTISPCASADRVAKMPSMCLRPDSASSTSTRLYAPRQAWYVDAAHAPQARAAADDHASTRPPSWRSSSCHASVLSALKSPVTKTGAPNRASSASALSRNSRADCLRAVADWWSKCVFSTANFRPFVWKTAQVASLGSEAPQLLDDFSGVSDNQKSPESTSARRAESYRMPAVSSSSVPSPTRPTPMRRHVLGPMSWMSSSSCQPRPSCEPTTEQLAISIIFATLLRRSSHVRRCILSKPSSRAHLDATRTL